MGSSTIPAVLAARMAKGVETGEKIVELVQKGVTTRDILTEEAFENAVMHLLTMGGSTNVFSISRQFIMKPGWGNCRSVYLMNSAEEFRRWPPFIRLRNLTWLTFTRERSSGRIEGDRGIPAQGYPDGIRPYNGGGTVTVFLYQ